MRSAKTSGRSVGKKADVVILAGGFGTRLASVLGPDIPKPMAQGDGKPLLEHQLKLCKRFGFCNVLILLHHLPQVITDYFGNGRQHRVWYWGIEKT